MTEVLQHPRRPWSTGTLLMKKIWNAVRLDDRKQVDDIAVTSDLFRLEAMDTNCWWACAYRGKDRIAFSIRSKTKITVTIIEDSIGCSDDAK